MLDTIVDVHATDHEPGNMSAPSRRILEQRAADLQRDLERAREDAQQCSERLLILRENILNIETTLVAITTDLGSPAGGGGASPSPSPATAG